MSNIRSLSGLYHASEMLPDLSHKGDSHPIVPHLVQRSAAREDGAAIRPLAIRAPTNPTPRVSIDFCEMTPLVGTLEKSVMSLPAARSLRSRLEVLIVMASLRV